STLMRWIEGVSRGPKSQAACTSEPTPSSSEPVGASSSRKRRTEPGGPGRVSRTGALVRGSRTTPTPARSRYSAMAPPTYPPAPVTAHRPGGASAWGGTCFGLAAFSGIVVAGGDAAGIGHDRERDGGGGDGREDGGIDRVDA